MASIGVICKILEGLDRGEIIAAIYFDLQKAFDTVDYFILLQKFYICGIKGNVYKWLQNYLMNRNQFAALRKFNSEL